MYDLDRPPFERDNGLVYHVYILAHDKGKLQNATEQMRKRSFA